MLLVLLLPGGGLFLIGMRALAQGESQGLLPAAAVLLGSSLIIAGGWYHYRTDYRNEGPRGTIAFIATTAVSALIALGVNRLLFK